MYIFRHGPSKKYASAAVSKRDGKLTSIDVQYLGTVIDFEKGIFKNKERGFFTFDATTGLYGEVPDTFISSSATKDTERTAVRSPKVSVDFGDAYFVDSFLRQSGMMEVIDQLDYRNKDTLHAMVLFYVLSSMANCDAIHWYEGSIAHMMYPKAGMSGQRISEFLEVIGTPERRLAYQQKYIQYVMNHYGSDFNVLVDSTGLPNGIHFPLTHVNVHNGKVSNETRLIFALQRSTGIPIYYTAIPGNVVDVSTLERVMLHLESLGVPISSCILDAGYNSSDNLELFYDENHKCKIGFITRVKANDSQYKAMIKENLATIDSKENFVKYGDRYLFIKKQALMVGKDDENLAYMYLGLDLSRVTDEQRKLFNKAAKKNLSMDEVYEAMQTEGLFGILSGYDYPCEEILPAYYQRQSAEQIFDFAKNYTKLLPLRTHSEATFQGHLLISYIASCVVKMIQKQLATADFMLGSRLQCLRNLKCTIYSTRIVTDHPTKIVNDTYQALGIKCPATLPIEEGMLIYEPPVKSSKNQSNVKKKKVSSERANLSKEQHPEISASTKKRGRPQKQQPETPVAPKKRGRPAKQQAEAPTTPKKRGRLHKKVEQLSIPAAPKKRGRPKKNQ